MSPDCPYPQNLTNRRSVVRTLGLATASFLPGLAHAAKSGWEIAKLNGRDYVSSDSIRRFYNFKTYSTSGGKVTLRSPSLQLVGRNGSQELIINRVKFILSFPATSHRGKIFFSRVDLVKLIHPVLRPTYIRVVEPFNTVIIDPGHGGHDPGAKSIYGVEKTFALDTAKRLRAELIRRGLRVKMTRDNDSYPSLPARVRFANKTPNAIFVSLHYNSGKSKSARGIETFALRPQGTKSTYEKESSADGFRFQGNQRDGENIALATAVHASALSKISGIDRGIKRSRFHVLRGINKPAILFEGGFLSNRSEAKKIATAAHRQALAESIGQGIMNYYRAVKKR